MKRYGIKLVLYGGQPMDMWVWDENGRFETTDQEVAYEERSKWSEKNPKGFYDIKEINGHNDI